MKKIRLVKGFTLIAALMAVAFVFGCSSSSSTSEPVVQEGNSTTVKGSLSLVDGGTLTTKDADGNASIGSATLTIDPNTVAYYDLEGLNGVTGAINVEIRYSDKDSTATFPGGSFNNVTLDGVNSTVQPEGWVDVTITDADGTPVVMFDPPITVVITDETIQASNWNIFNVQEAHAMNICPAYVKPLINDETKGNWDSVASCNDTTTACDVTSTFLVEDTLEQISICEIGNTDKAKERKFRICTVSTGKWQVGTMCSFTGAN